MHSRRPSRRDFVSAVAAAPLLLPACTSRQTGGTPPSEKLNVAFIGIGGLYGPRAIQELRDHHNVVALCDVDWRTQEQLGDLGVAVTPAIQLAADYPNVPRFDDWRRMLEEKDRDIDAVVVCTADHTHAAAAICPPSVFSFTVLMPLDSSTP